jgi:hypothetical protein
MAEEAHRRYAEIMQDVELMIDDHSKTLYPYVSSNSFVLHWILESQRSFVSDPKNKLESLW